jgi:hypothetical protein
VVAVVAMVVAADTERVCGGHNFRAAANDSFIRRHVVADARDGFIDGMIDYCSSSLE